MLPANIILKSITKAQLCDLIEAKEDAAPAMARYLFAVIRPFFDICVERDLVEVSPLSAIRAPAVVKARDRILSDDEIRKFW